MNSELATDGLQCAFCQESLDFMSISGREAHYEQHFMNADPENDSSDVLIVDIPTTSPSNGGGGGGGQGAFQEGSSKSVAHKTKRAPWSHVKETDPFWLPDQLDPPPKNFTPALIPLLRKGLLRGQSNQRIRKAVLCYEKTVHVSRDMWDVSWGCGYRNFLMVCASLMSQTQQPMYFPLLDAPISPSIRNLQRWIEDAWSEGFDPEGKKQLKELVGSKKWIGTSGASNVIPCQSYPLFWFFMKDLWVAFTFRGIPAELVDFDLRNREGPEAVIKWVVEYFTPKDANQNSNNAFQRMRMPTVQTTEKIPIILQHNGHSRTIVGYDVDSRGLTSLLTFDPGFKLPQEMREAALKEFNHQRASADPPSPTDTVASTSSLKRRRSHDSSDIEIVEVKTPRIEPLPPKNTSPKKVLSNIKKGLHAHGHKKDGTDLDLWTMTQKFRLDLKNLSKKKEYQILYFPMTAPLTEYERKERKDVVRSTRIS
ncbi:peptidase family C78-domain-containing protein [Crepidotus variabilis]|uniref:Peptidase family C78-domain-containing protein n=1 Tax=Crepidotus variabilis TaxID=179855 RepID=A0A9P6JTW7_9AGAR|nr:peptidase family C78-domain-containing protein [Crepidotus variabilis]